MTNRWLVAVIIVLVVAGSFLFGRLWNENRTLKSQSTTSAALPTPAGSSQQSAAAQPKPEEVAQPVTAGTIPAPNDADHREGSAAARVFLIEYSDLECPYCERFVDTREDLMNRYQGDLAHIYRHFPIESHRNAEYLAITAECIASAANDEEYFRFIDTLYSRNSSQGGFSPEVTQTLIEEFGWARDRITACLQDGSGKSRVTADKSGGSQAGVTGTPTIFIVDQNGAGYRIVGAHDAEVFEYAITSVLNQQ